MKKSILVLFLLIFIVPSITFASWWNPVSWFNNWSFNRKEVAQQVQSDIQKTQEEKINTLQKQFDELKNKQTESSTSIITTKEKIESNNDFKNNKKTTAIDPQKSTNPTIQPIFTTAPILVQTQASNINSVRCKLSKEKTLMKRGDTIRVSLYDLNEGISKYDVVWDNKYLEKIIDSKEASFVFKDIGTKIISATVTRKSDGVKKEITCATITISCDSFDCLSESEKKIFKLKEISNTIDSWYDNKYPNLSPEDRCSISESIIRALEYEYTLIGGINIPVFSKGIDCANSVAPKAYKYKIQLLIDSL